MAGKDSGGLGLAVVVVAVLLISGTIKAPDLDVDLDLPSLRDLPAAPTSAAPRDPNPALDDGLLEPAAARAALAKLPIGSRPPEKSDGYRRDAFGPAWDDVDNNGCSTRQDVLYEWVDRSQPVDARRSGRCAHSMWAGTWVSPYDGRARTFTNLKDPQQAQQLPVDHVVPLREAYVSGANDWTADRRLQFANDTTNLVPVSRADNSSKGGSDAAAWRPTKAYQCGYARRYVTVKAKYRLLIDPSEKDALQQMLQRCR